MAIEPAAPPAADPAAPAAPVQTPTPGSTQPAAPSSPTDPAPSPVAPLVDPNAPPSVLDPAKPDEPAKPADPPAVPETYEFTPPEVDGKPVAVDADALTALQGVAKEAGLTQAQFQAVGEHGARILTERLAAVQQAGVDQGVAAFRGMCEQWGNETRADPLIGGDKLPATLANVTKALEAFGNDTVRAVLINSGSGNNVEVVRMLARIGEAVGDPTKLSFGKPADGKAKSGEQAARDIYNAGGGNYPPVAA